MRVLWRSICLWLAVFVLAGLGVYRRIPLAYLIVLFLVLIGGLGNRHLQSGVECNTPLIFPRPHHCPFCLLAGIMLLTRLFAGTRAQQVCEQSV